MRAARNTSAHKRRALIWLAVAAMTIAYVAAGPGGPGRANVYANPVLQFLAGHDDAGALNSTVTSFVHSSRQHDTGPRAWLSMLPVFFIGLVAPLSLISARAALSLGRAPAPPALPFSFQRPPPSFLL